MIKKNTQTKKQPKKFTSFYRGLKLLGACDAANPFRYQTFTQALAMVGDGSVDTGHVCEIFGRLPNGADVRSKIARKFDSERSCLCELDGKGIVKALKKYGLPKVKKLFAKGVLEAKQRGNSFDEAAEQEQVDAEAEFA